MSEKSVYPDDLVTLTTTETDFQAGILVAVLDNAGIKAFSFGAVSAMEPLGKRLTPVVVQVRQADVDRARAALAQNVADSVDLDWDQVDVGERVDDLPLTTREGMPPAARIAWLLTLLLLGTVVLGLIITIVLAYSNGK